MSIEKTYLIYYRSDPRISEQYSTKRLLSRTAIEALQDFEFWAKGMGMKDADDISVCEVILTKKER